MTMQALHRACREDNLLLVSIMLDRHGVEVNAKDKQGRTALHLAAMDNNQLLAEMLFQHGADTRAASNRGLVPLDCASDDEMTVLLAKMMARDGGYDLIKERLKLLNKPQKLKQRIAKELDRVPHEKRTLPLLASLVSKPRITLTNIFGMRDSDSRRSSVSDSSKLSIADSGYSDLDRCNFNSLESFQTIGSECASGVKLSKERRVTTALTKQELNAIQLVSDPTIERSLTEPVKNVLRMQAAKVRRKTHPTRRATAEVDTRDAAKRRKRQVTFPSDVLLDVAVANDDFVEACHLIKSRKVDFNRPGPNGLTPLHRAAIEGSYECLQLLVDQGANVNIRDQFGWLPLHDAVYHGHISCVLALLKAGTDVSAKTGDFDGLLELVGDKDMLLVVGRAIILNELGFVSDIEEAAQFFPDTERESCV